MSKYTDQVDHISLCEQRAYAKVRRARRRTAKADHKAWVRVSRIVITADGTFGWRA